MTAGICCTWNKIWYIYIHVYRSVQNLVLDSISYTVCFCICSVICLRLNIYRFDKSILEFPEVLDQDQHELLHEMIVPIEKYFAEQGITFFVFLSVIMGIQDLDS